MASFKPRRKAYSIGSPLANMAPIAIESNRAPKSSDKGERVGQLWIDKSSNIYYVLTSVTNGSSQWTTTDINSSSGDVAISTTGSVSIASSEDTIGAISLSTSGGTSESIVISSTAGTAVNSVDIGSDDGGVLISGGLASDEAVALSASNAAGGILLDAGATPGVTVSNGTQSFQILTGSGSPDTVVTASQGSLYVDVAASTGTTILWCNTNGGTGWSAVGV